MQLYYKTYIFAQRVQTLLTFFKYLALQCDTHVVYVLIWACL
jgi:hypothetical protein